MKINENLKRIIFDKNIIFIKYKNYLIELIIIYTNYI